VTASAGDETYIVVGAGGIGGVVAAGLVDAGLDVHIIDADESHVRAIQANGLRVTGLIDRLVRVRASLPGDAPLSFGRVVLAVKAHHVDSALALIGPRLKADGVVLSLPNGLAAIQVARAVGEARTIAGQATFGAQVVGPAHVAMGAGGSVVFGEYGGGISPRSQRIGQDLDAAIGGVTVTEASMAFVWSKFVLATIYIGTALDGRPMADVFGDADSRGVLAVLAGAIVDLSREPGVSLRPIGEVDVASLADPRAVSWQVLQREAEAARGRRPRGGVYEDIVVRRRPTEVPAMLAPALSYARPGTTSDRVIRALSQRIAAAERDPSLLAPGFLRAVLVDAAIG
jgi:2-dehydropantoate 2-reductase